MKNRISTKNKSLRTFAVIMAVMMILGIFSPVYAREYYNYESRYTITLSEEAYERMSKVNDNIMSIIYGDGVSMTFAATNYYSHLSDEQKIPELTADDYSVGNEVFSATYNDATYMKDDYFTKRLSNVSGDTEMAGVTLKNINGYDLWEMTYYYLDEATDEMIKAAEEAKKAAEEAANAAEGDTAEVSQDNEGEISDEEPSAEELPEGELPEGEDTEEPEVPVISEEEPFPIIRDDGMAIIGEGKMYFTVYKGYEYRIHMMNKQGRLSEQPEMAEILGSARLGLRQSDIMKIMWITIAVLCALCFILIIFVLTRKSPKKLAKIRKAAGLDENGNLLPQTLAIEGAVEFDEEAQLKNNEMINAKLEMMAKGNSPAEEEQVVEPSEEADMIITEYIPVITEESADNSIEETTDEEINSFLDSALEEATDMDLELDIDDEEV